MTGDWPKEMLDHINRNPADNRWCNLREVTRAENRLNSIDFVRRGLIDGATLRRDRLK